MKTPMMIIGMILLFLLLVVLTLPFWFDLNRYRDQYLPLMEQALNREVEMPSVRMMWFPHLGIQAENVKIYDVPDIAHNPFVTVPSIEFAIKWPPLLRGHVEVQSLTLRQPTITVIRTKDGDFNVSTLGSQHQQMEQTSKPDESSQSVLALFGVEQLIISDGRFRYEDRSEGPIHAYQLKHIHIQTKGVRLGDMAKITAQGTVMPSHMPLSLEGSFGPLQSNLDIPHIEAQLQLGTSSVLTKGHVRDRKLDLDVTSSNISLDDFPINFGMNKPVRVTDLFAHIQAPLAMPQASASSPKEIMVNPLRFYVDMGETRLNLSGQAIGSKLEMHGTTPILHSTDLPLSLPLPMPVSLKNLAIQTIVNGSLVQVVALKGDLFEGHLEANGQWNGEGAIPTFESIGTIQNVNVEYMQKVLAPTTVTITGEGTVNWKIAGTLPFNARPLLNGSTHVRVTKGQLKGFDLLERIEHVLKVRKVLSAERGVTSFSTFSGNVAFQGDRYPIQSVVLEGHKHEFLMQGSGIVTSEQTVTINGDLRLGEKVSNKILRQFPLAKVALQQNELVVPFLVTGPLSGPKIGLDVKSIQRQVQKQVGKTLEKVLQGDPQDVQDILKQGKGLLKQFFGK